MKGEAELGIRSITRNDNMAVLLPGECTSTKDPALGLLANVSKFASLAALCILTSLRKWLGGGVGERWET